MKDCPVRAGSALATSLTAESTASVGGEGSTRCYNCGGTHRLKECTEPKVGGGTSYATCFVCQQTGHIARNCPKNTHGIYVSGGSCKRCGSVEHLVSECPVLRDEHTATTSSTSDAVITKQDVKKKKNTLALGDDLEGNLALGKEAQDEEDEEEEGVSSGKSKKKKSKKIRTL